LLRNEPEITFLDKYTVIWIIDKWISRSDTVLVSGGRDSGKDFWIGCFVGTAAEQF
jgi:hypothetical protein